MDPHQAFKENEILIGNYRFERKDKFADWTIVEITQVGVNKDVEATFRIRT